MFLLFLTGVGPLLAWRKTSWESMKHIFMWPTLLGVVTAIGLVIFGIRSIYPVMSFSLSVFVLVTLFSEFNRGARARMRNTGENMFNALIGLTMANKRRYGGYITHLGFLMLIVGFTGQAFTTEGWGEVKEGDKFTIGKYDFECLSIDDVSNANFEGMSATVAVSTGGKKIAELSPEKRFYPASEQTTSEVRMHHTPLEDVYVVFANVKEQTGAVVMQVWINPLVSWVWLGGYVLVGGTIITLLPNRRERRVKKQKRSVEKLLEDAEELVTR